MAQHRRDLGQRAPAGQQLGRDRVPQPVRPDPRDASPVARVAEDRPNRFRRERAIGRERAQEHLAEPSIPPPIENMLDERLADILREREPVGLRALPADRQLAGTPIDVIQQERHDLARRQRKSRQQRQDREITPADRRRAVTTGEQPRDLLRLDSAGQRAQTPARDARDRLHQRHRHPARHMQEDQQGTQPAGQRLRPRHPASSAAALGHHEARHASGAKLQQRDVDRVPKLAKEEPRDSLAQNDRPLHQPPLVDEILAVVRNHTLKRRAGHGRRRHRADTAQKAQQLVHPPRTGQVRVALVPSLPESLNRVNGER